VPDDFTWVQPAGETSNTASLTTQSTPGVPATDGVAQFQYAPKNTTTRTVRISETVQGRVPAELVSTAHSRASIRRTTFTAA
jgi:hypothetical protein